MKNVNLSVCFKGARQYIHGTDMLDQCIALLIERFAGVMEQVDFLIRRMTDRNLFLSLYPAELAPALEEQDVAVLRFVVAGRNWDARISCAEDSPDCRINYDEDAVVASCSFDSFARKVELRQEVGYTVVETLVATTKALHLRVFPDIQSGWMFCRLTSPVWPPAESLEGGSVQLTQTLGTRLTRSEVSCAGKVLGQIYFSTKGTI